MKRICFLSALLIGLLTLVGCQGESPNSPESSEKESACEHVAVAIPHVDPTCVETGRDGGEQCSKCEIVLTASNAIPANGQHEYGADGFCVVCKAEKPKPTEGLEYRLSDDGSHYIVSGIGTATATDIVIADVYEGLPVKEVGDSAFSGSDTILSVVLPNGVVRIGQEAFMACQNMKSISIPDSVTSIGKGAFKWCYHLTDICLPSGLEILEREVFSTCTALTNITIPNGVKNIGFGAFSGCSGLTSVTISNTVEIINRSFSDCSSLTSITIPVSLTSIEGAFFGCSSLMSISVAEGNPVYHASGNCLIETASKTLVAGCQTSVIPTDGSVTKIGEDAFSGCNNLESMIIPNTVIWIDSSAFGLCDSLTNITIPDSVTSIGSAAFGGCSSLTDIAIPNSVTSIDYAAFRGCSSLTSITIPDSVTSIGSDAFSDCSSLTSITIPDSVTKLGEYAFGGCTNLKRVSIGNGLIEIGNNYSKPDLFKNSASLIQIEFPSGNPYFMNEMFAGSDQLFNKGAGVIYIGDWVVDAIYIQVKEVTIRGDIVGISRGAFGKCAVLEIIHFDGTVEQWEALDKVEGWDTGTPVYTVICTDGSVKKDGTVTSNP